MGLGTRLYTILIKILPNCIPMAIVTKFMVFGQILFKKSMWVGGIIFLVSKDISILL